jgi:membrane associated rhomboid family serine protease
MALFRQRAVFLSGGRTTSQVRSLRARRTPSPRAGRRPLPRITWSIAASLVVVFLLQLAQMRRGFDPLAVKLAFSHAAWDQHRYWTAVTYAWAHGTSIFGQPGLFWLHLVSNVVPLFYLGPALEEMLGQRRFLGLYLGGVVAAALVWLMLTRSGSPQAIIGASGAIFALLAAAGTAAPGSRAILFLGSGFLVLPRFFRFGMVTALICGAELVQLLFGWLPQVAHAAHLGGAVFGFLYIKALRWKARHPKPSAYVEKDGKEA